MKKYLLAIILGLFIISSQSCKKEDPKTEDPSETPKDIRVKQIISYNANGNVEFKYDYTYDSDKITRIDHFKQIDGDTGLVKYLVEDITYNGSDVTNTWSWLNSDNNTLELFFKDEFIIKNGKISEVIYSDYDNNQWEVMDKDEYEYSGENLIKRLGYSFYENQVYELNWTTEYTYTSDKLQESNVYIIDNNGDATLHGKEEFTYSGSNVGSYIKYQKNESDIITKLSRGDYSYSGNELVDFRFRYWDESANDWESDFWSLSYTYNSAGKVSEVVHDDNSKSIYEYEDGKSNYGILSLPESVFYNIPISYGVSPKTDCAIGIKKRTSFTL